MRKKTSHDSGFAVTKAFSFVYLLKWHFFKTTGIRYRYKKKTVGNPLQITGSESRKLKVFYLPPSNNLQIYRYSLINLKTLCEMNVILDLWGCCIFSRAFFHIYRIFPIFISLPRGAAPDVSLSVMKIRSFYLLRFGKWMFWSRTRASFNLNPKQTFASLNSDLKGKSRARLGKASPGVLWWYWCWMIK